MIQKLNGKINSSSSVNWLRLLFVLCSTVFVLLSGFIGCTESKESKKIASDQETRPKSVEPSRSNSSSEKKLESSPRAEFETPEDILLRALDEADQIHREVLGVLLKDNFPLHRSFFGKAFRAIRQSRKMGLRGKSAFRCDTYSMSKNKSSLGDYPFHLKLLHKCPGKNTMEEFSEISMMSSNQIRARFESKSLEEVVGLGSSILHRTFQCEIKLKNSGLIESMTCEGVLQDKSPEEIYEFSKYNYSSEENSMIVLEGKLLKNLVPQRSVKFTVPLEGKIKIQEKELLPKDPVVDQVPRPSLEDVYSLTPEQIQEKRKDSGNEKNPEELHEPEQNDIHEKKNLIFER